MQIGLEERRWTKQSWSTKINQECNSIHSSASERFLHWTWSPHSSCWLPLRISKSLSRRPLALSPARQSWTRIAPKKKSLSFCCSDRSNRFFCRRWGWWWSASPAGRDTLHRWSIHWRPRLAPSPCNSAAFLVPARWGSTSCRWGRGWRGRVAVRRVICPSKYYSTLSLNNWLWDGAWKIRYH